MTDGLAFVKPVGRQIYIPLWINRTRKSTDYPFVDMRTASLLDYGHTWRISGADRVLLIERGPDNGLANRR